MAAAWFDEREPEHLHLARGTGRPLWLGQGREGTFFASTELALEILEHYCGVALRRRQVHEGTLLELREGTIASGVASRRSATSRTIHSRRFVRPASASPA